MDIQLPATFGEFLTWFGSSAVIGALISWVAAHWPWFKGQSGAVKVAVLLLISTIMGLVSFLAIKYVPAGVIEDVQPYYQIALNSVVIVLAAQGYDFLVNKAADRRPIIIEGLPIEWEKVEADEDNLEGGSG